MDDTRDRAIITAMGRRRGGSRGQRHARLLWQGRTQRLFDPAGLEYELSRVGLRRAEITRLLARSGIPVAVHDCGRGVSWCSGDTATAQWNAAQSDFEDVKGWRPPSDAPGTLPYRAELWRAQTGEDEVIVLRND